MKLPDKYQGLARVLALVVALPAAAWLFAVGDTVRVWSDCRQLDARLSAIRPASIRTAALLPDDRELVLSGVLLDSVRLAAEGRGVRVAGYEPCVTLHRDGLALHTAQVALTGSYTDLLEAVAHLERSLPACRLRTMEWRTASDRRTRQQRLTLILYIQQIVLKP